MSYCCFSNGKFKTHNDSILWNNLYSAIMNSFRSYTFFCFGNILFVINISYRNP